MDEPPIFIVGCPRSGTSLLRDLLCSSSRIAIPPESHFIPRFYAAWGDPDSDQQAEALARRILSLKTIRLWDLSLEPAELASCRSFAALVAGVHRRFATQQGKTRWGDKTPHYVSHLPLLARLFPEGRFIHIYRDGRDVASSWVARAFGPGNGYGAATAWRDLVRTGRADGAKLGGAYLELRFETLVEHPEETMQAVCDFLDADFEPAMLMPSEAMLRYRVASRPRPGPGVLPEKAFQWREGMAVADRAIVESVAGDLLGELGYELEGLARPIGLPTRMRLGAGSAAGAAWKRLNRRQFTIANGVLLARAALRSRAGPVSD